MPTDSIAALVPAVPGWRAVTVTLGEPFKGEDGQEYYNTALNVVPVDFWGLSLAARKPSKYSIYADFGTSLSPLFGVFGGSDDGPYLIPFCKATRLEKVYRLVSPDEVTTDAELLQEARDHIQTVNATLSGGQ